MGKARKPEILQRQMLLRSVRPECPTSRPPQSAFDSPLSVNADDLRVPDQRILIDALVTVDEKPWLRQLDGAI